MELEKNNYLTTAPHIRASWSSKWIMRQVMIALVFPTIAATYFFGMHSVELVACSILCCMLLESLWQRLIVHSRARGDGSSIITGWLLALSVPITTPVWIIFIADFIAIILVKEAFGGVGKNILNPAVTARICLRLFFKQWISIPNFSNSDVVTSATPINNSLNLNLTNLFLGIDISGAIGETCKLALLISAIYLIVKKIIDPSMPVITIISFFISFFCLNSFDFHRSVMSVFSGALIFCSIFMVTDYTTTPLSTKGKYIFSASCGCIAAVIRTLPILPFPEGIGISIIIMNLFVFLINNITTPKIYGRHDY